MLVFALALAWCLLLVGLAVAAALLGRPPREAGPDAATAYELSRWSDRAKHSRRVREEELTELRRRRTGGKPEA